jgi:hypothetical protein
VHDETRHAKGGQPVNSFDRRGLRGVRSIIADPGLEQIAQNVKGIRIARLGGEKIQELRGDRRTTCVDVQIRDEKRGHLGLGTGYGPATRSIF